jgi:Fe-S cluster assembly protein SufB
MSKVSTSTQKINTGIATDAYHFKAQKGLSKEVVESISKMKGEPSWMTEFRLSSYDVFDQKPMPQWGGYLDNIDFNNIHYYVDPTGKGGKEAKRSWDDIPSEIKKTFDAIGIPQAEQKYLAGVEAQFESEVVYGSILKALDDKGVIFTDTDTALRKYPHFFKEYFGKLIPPHDNKFAALNSAVWSGGSFIYVPKGVKITLPLQAYFRINIANMGQFERTLIIVDEGAYVNYVEGCSAPIYTTDSLHSAVVEIFVKPGARCRYTTIQNWSNNVYNLVTKRAQVEENAVMEWVDANIGSQLTMKYPSVYLTGEGAHGEVLSLAVADKGQHQDVGAKAFHFASNTTSKIQSKSISQNGGRSSYRGLVSISPNAKNCRSKVDCEALITDSKSRSDTYPTMVSRSPSSTIEHEATVSKIGEDQLFYLMSRGLTEEQAANMIVAGFIEPIVKELPMEYAVELNRLVKLQIEGGVG